AAAGLTDAALDPDPQRAGRAPPEAQGASRPRRPHALGLSPLPPPRPGPASYTPGAPGAPRVAQADPPPDSDGRAGEEGARLAVIVVDASVVIDVLLGVPGAEAFSARLFAEEGGLAAPHLIDIEVAPHGLRCAYVALAEALDAPLLTR